MMFRILDRTTMAKDGVRYSYTVEPMGDDTRFTLIEINSFLRLDFRETLDLIESHQGVVNQCSGNAFFPTRESARAFIQHLEDRYRFLKFGS